MIVIVGHGNVAFHLYEALKDHLGVCLLNSHSPENLPEDTSLIILAVSDDAIEEIVEKLPPTEAVVAHTSGSVSLQMLKKFPNAGVFYPLQTFTKGTQIDYSEIPVFVEGTTEKVTGILKRLASLFTGNVYEADSEKRRILHLASVFASNFTNALAAISADLLAEADIDFKTLLPLMKLTVKKLEDLSPTEAQTGPAKRGDSTIIEKHLEMLEEHPRLQSIYSLLTEEIIERNKKSLHK